MQQPTPPPAIPNDKLPANLKQIPAGYQALDEYFRKVPGMNVLLLREETILRIEKITGRPLICYVSKTNETDKSKPVHINDDDLVGFDDLTRDTKGDNIDIFLVSNGGSAEAAERIINLIRERYKSVRFIIPANAYSAATLMCFAGDEIIMDIKSTLGPIDPQINGIPARAIQRAFESIEERIVKEGPKALAAYMPLISKYDLHVLEICKSVQELSNELAASWLSSYMLKCDEADQKVTSIVNFFADYDIHKSHGRSINRNKSRELGLKVVNAEDVNDLAPLVSSLYNQYLIMMDRSGFFKLYENSHGIHWGRQAAALQFQLPLAPGSMPPFPFIPPMPIPPK